MARRRVKIQFVKIKPAKQCNVCKTKIKKEDGAVHDIQKGEYPIEVVDTQVRCFECFAKSEAEKYHRIHKDGETLWNVDSLRLAQEIGELLKAEVESVSTKDG